jgi:alpha-D-xyloside xylohydrolase
MKFTDGYWQMRPGVTPHYPAHVHEVEIEQHKEGRPAALVAYGPTKWLNHRAIHSTCRC